MKLIRMTDFVLKKDEELDYLADFYSSVLKYAKFLKQPLTLGMFVPCVDNEPFNHSKHGNKEELEKAKERVLFEGF